jgi:hypothetical protein
MKATRKLKDELSEASHLPYDMKRVLDPASVRRGAAMIQRLGDGLEFFARLPGRGTGREALDWWMNDDDPTEGGYDNETENDPLRRCIAGVIARVCWNAGRRFV